MLTLFIFLAVLLVLVLSHEFGHFMAARLCGLKVEEFGFGFPPRLASFMAKSGTRYSLNWLPLGGFVKIKGEDGASEHDPDSFASHPVWQRMAVVVAGVVMNFLVGWLLISLVFFIGTKQYGGGNEAAPTGRAETQIMEILPGKPAEAAGLKAGDVITQVDGLIAPRLTELQEYVNSHKDANIMVTVRRGSEVFSRSIHPAVYADTGRGGLGVAIAEVTFIKYPWYRALWQGAITSVSDVKEIFKGLGALVAGLFRGAGVGSAVSGPVGVAVMTGQAARLGWATLLQFVALLSLNLAVLNILPIPALDGGRLLFLVLGKIFRRPSTFKYETLIHNIGFIALILLVLAVTIKDVSGFWGVLSGWVKAL